HPTAPNPADKASYPSPSREKGQRLSESDNPFHHFVIPAKAGIQVEQAMPRTYHVYILASKRNGTLYVGVTSNLAARIFAHRNGKGAEFTKNIASPDWSISNRSLMSAMRLPAKRR
ncbi:GIY-YIG nuclease family protein, partial [Sphingopyxis sp. BSNA05]|uniref:GIY-YIG nuclease family protein n=1 Tax=Sphingopyxis sp. BSNA05 TaxID=1236614 RepID=UPI00349F31B1